MIPAPQCAFGASGDNILAMLEQVYAGPLRAHGLTYRVTRPDMMVVLRRDKDGRELRFSAGLLDRPLLLANKMDETVKTLLAAPSLASEQRRNARKRMWQIMGRK